MTVVAVTALALLLRLWLVPHLTLIETDGVSYAAIARQFLETGSPYQLNFHPLYPLAMVAVEPLVGDWELTGRLISAVFGAAVIVPAFALVRGLCGASTATVTAVLLAIHPAMVRSGTAVLAEAFYSFLVISAMWAGLRGLTERRWLVLVAAALTGAAYLAKPEGLAYVVLLAGLVLFHGIRSRRYAQATLWTAATLAIFLLIASPYLVYLRATLGFWTLSGKIVHNLGQDLRLAGTLGQSDLALLARHAGLLPRHVAENAFLFLKYALPDVLPGVLLLFMLPGILGRPRAALGKGPIVLALFAVPPFATLLFHVESRLWVPALPFLLPFAALGILATGGWLGGDARHHAWTAALVVIVVLALAPSTLRPIVRPDRGATVYRRAAEWVRATQPGDALLLDRKPFVAFYSDRRFAPLLDVAPDDLARVAREAGASLVVLDSRVLGDRAALIPFVYASPPAGLDIAQDFDAAPGERMRILRVLRHG